MANENEQRLNPREAAPELISAMRELGEKRRLLCSGVKCGGTTPACLAGACGHALVNAGTGALVGTRSKSTDARVAIDSLCPAQLCERRRQAALHDIGY